MQGKNTNEDRPIPALKEDEMLVRAEAFNAGDWETISKIERPGIKEAVKTMESIMANPDQRQLIWDRHLALMDYNSELISARQEGREEGWEEGLEEGLGKGIIQTRLESIKSLMTTLKLSSKEAMDALQISSEDQEEYAAQL